MFCGICARPTGPDRHLRHSTPRTGKLTTQRQLGGRLLTRFQTDRHLDLKRSILFTAPTGPWDTDTTRLFSGLTHRGGWRDDCRRRQTRGLRIQQHALGCTKRLLYSLRPQLPPGPGTEAHFCRPWENTTDATIPAVLRLLDREHRLIQSTNIMNAELTRNMDVNRDGALTQLSQSGMTRLSNETLRTPAWRTPGSTREKPPLPVEPLRPAGDRLGGRLDWFKTDAVTDS